MVQLYNRYADQAGYFDIMLLIFQAAEWRNKLDIRETWRALLAAAHERAVERGAPHPYEAAGSAVRDAARRVGPQTHVFLAGDVVELLQRYRWEHQRGVGPASWIIDLLVDLDQRPERLYPELQRLLLLDQRPFDARACKTTVARDMLYVGDMWLQEAARAPGPPFGGDAALRALLDSLQYLLELPWLPPELQTDARRLRRAVEFRQA